MIYIGPIALSCLKNPNNHNLNIIGTLLTKLPSVTHSYFIYKKDK